MSVGAKPGNKGIEQPAAHKGPAARLRHKPGHRQAPQREPENVMSAENEIREIVSRYTRAADWRDGEAPANMTLGNACLRPGLIGSNLD